MDTSLGCEKLNRQFYPDEKRLYFSSPLDLRAVAHAQHRGPCHMCAAPSILSWAQHVILWQGDSPDTKHRAEFRHHVAAPLCPLKSTQKSVPSVPALCLGTKHAEIFILLSASLCFQDFSSSSYP